MAKYAKYVHGQFEDIVETLHNAILHGSTSASYEEGTDYWSPEGFRSTLRVYERYSWSGGNRVSLAMSVTGANGYYMVSLITSGGSQAMFFKMNTWGEEAFLERIVKTLEKM